MPLLEKLQSRHGSDHLGHTHDPEGGILVQGLPAFSALLSKLLVIDHLAVFANDSGQARNVPCVDKVLEQRIEFGVHR